MAGLKLAYPGLTFTFFLAHRRGPFFCPFVPLRVSLYGFFQLLDYPLDRYV
jgi:hypothetical protein